MRFDDRLLTVLKLPAGDRHDAAVRWRQLVDLVARAGPNAASPMVARALDSIRDEAANVDENLRAAAARAVAALPLPLGLLEYFASDALTVSAPVLAAASLDQGQWQALLAAADDEARRFMQALHPELKVEAAPDLTEMLVEAPAGAAPAEALPTETPSLHEVVARIERRRRSRESVRPRAAEAESPQGSPALFRWECGPSGEIAWVEGAPRGALIGRSIARAQNGDADRVDSDVVRAFALRTPFRDAGLSVGGDGLVSGEWKISGVPAFDPADGRFAGYRGIALREHAPAVAREPGPDLLADPDSLRELVHEIKTPLNAIIGFAEIIEGQFLGPADRRYRERARDIVRQAHLLLTAIDDLDFVAKIHSSGGSARARTNLRELLERLLPSLRENATERGIELDLVRRTAEVVAAIEPELADRLIFRLLSGVAECGASGERLRVTVDQSGDQCRISIGRPASLRGVSDQQLFGAATEAAIDECFSLRLTSGLAHIAGAELASTQAAIAILFPRA
ncbi:MAG TPA: histidine kinase dimerization/phospho-acceptor domain-containing protein [Sphingomicrobium sp.]|nr:histidine kinase dimerization/phospho-acceptor domain-containing protein [Sphingomicrobium sp.]